MRIAEKLRATLKDYCMHSTLTGLNHIANKKHHFTERLFWLFCFLASLFGSYFLIGEIIAKHQTDVMSIIVEALNLHDVTNFPSMGVCEVGYKHTVYSRLDDIMEGLKPHDDADYNAEVDGFLLRVIFHNMPKHNEKFTDPCPEFWTCDDCVKCPLNNYLEYADKVRANCSELFARCEFNGMPFNCCDFFKPLRTSVGTCFLLNSIQVSEKNPKEWMDLPVALDTGPGHLKLELLKSAWLYILNEEDIPHLLLRRFRFPMIPPGFNGEVFLSLLQTVNEESVRQIDPMQRKCYFPDEQFSTKYKYYSFSVCVTECLKQTQLESCNCTHHNLIYDKNDQSSVCGYDGLECLEKNELLDPQIRLMQPWHAGGLQCHCFPSCNEHEIKLVEHSYRLMQDHSYRSMSIRLQQKPNQRYRRHTVREKLDIVVSVGSILGMCLGASLLSLYEFLHFFTIRALGTYCQRRRGAGVGSHDK